jgi:hypothetical protein
MLACGVLLHRLDIFRLAKKITDRKFLIFSRQISLVP